MKQMINIALNSEFNFKNCYGKIEDLIKYGEETGALGVADTNNTFSHILLEKHCKKAGIKPLFGVRLMVVDKPEEKVRSRFGPTYIFIAKNQTGLQEIYELTTIAYQKFYYKAMISIDDMLQVSNNVFVIAENLQVTERVDFIGVSFKTPKMILDLDIPKIALQCNRYSQAEDKTNYQVLAGARKHGDGYVYNFNSQTYPQHILSTEEWFAYFKDEEAIENTHHLVAECDVKIPSAPMVAYKGSKSLDDVCRKTAFKKGIDLSDPEYKERYEREMALIDEKEYTDYFLINHDMINRAKKTMLVGPARGSAAGSLVCYLSDITTVDPIEHGLLFERFIDINRHDLPDIDIDFPDTKRQKVIKQLLREYGEDNVCHIANINRMKGKSAINEVAMALSISKFEADTVKDALVDRSGGAARADKQAEDTLKSTDIGREFLAKYPGMKAVMHVENHATHAGKHAAGIIVCNEPINKFGAINTRENTIMMDKKGAEAKNLLKIDCLGLRTLTILEEAADLIGMKYEKYYDLPLDDPKAIQIFNDMRLSGIFQYEGSTMRMLCHQMGIRDFNDIVALTALSRPGPLNSGAANTYVKRRIGEAPLEYICKHPNYIKHTKDTQGVIVYQEQLMKLCRECGNMSWEDVSEIRRAASKTMGEEFLEKYRKPFLKGAIEENNIKEEEAVAMWEAMMTFGAWGMNLSHSVSYGYISYWCAYMKAYHPLEFSVAILNNSKDDASSIKFLRDVTEQDGIEYCPVDPDKSMAKWTIEDGKLLGGLTNIPGIADKKAMEIIKKRKEGALPTMGMVSKLLNPKTIFDTLYPCRDMWGEYYTDPMKFGIESNHVSYIKDIHEPGEYICIGKVIVKELRDLNEHNEILKRGGNVLKKDSKLLKLIIEDDTDDIYTSINRFNFDKMNGLHYNEVLKVDQSWVIIKGVVKEGWRSISINAIHHLGDSEIL